MNEGYVLRNLIFGNEFAFIASIPQLGKDRKEPKMKSKEPRYSIGDFVKVQWEMSREGFRHIIWIARTFGIKPRLGQIVGLATRYSGDRTISLNMGDPSYFTPSESHTFWLVRFGLLNKPVCVREEDMRLARVDEVKELPRLYMRRCRMGSREKKLLSEDSKSWPRDSRGRWISGPLIHK